jgi:hypothetical protein
LTGRNRRDIRRAKSSASAGREITCTAQVSFADWNRVRADIHPDGWQCVLLHHHYHRHQARNHCRRT